MGDPEPFGGFGSRVAATVAATGPLCAGIDPSGELLGQWGMTDDAKGLRQFGIRCIEAFAGVVPVVKTQVAFFERFGSTGLAALEWLLVEARAAGLLVIADAKRADIGNTMAAYATAWLDSDSPLCADAVTAVPYLGLGALQPMIDLAGAHRRGVIVVVRSSNPEGRIMQEALTHAGAGPSVEDMLLAEIAQANRAGGAPSGTIGAVVGATLQPSTFPLPELGGTILAPGVGAQGASAADVGALFRGCAPGSVLANVSRSVLVAGPDVRTLAAAARRARDEMGEVLA